MFLWSILDQLPVGVVIAEAPEGVIHYANAACERLLGGTTAWQEHGADFDRWTPCYLDGRPYPRHARPIYRALAGEAVAGEQLQFHRPDGSTLILRVHASPVRDASGAAVAGVVAFEDATGEHRAHEALQRLNMVLEGQVAERTTEVRALTAALSLAEQRERGRIAQILHDDLQQILYGARFQLQGLIDEVRRLEGEHGAGKEEHTATYAALARARELLGTALRLIRTLTLDLHPPVSAEDGLGASLGWLGRHVQETHGLRVVVCDEGAAPLPPDLHDLLFQLARELLFNVAKHAAVDEATLTLRADDEVVMLQVEDHGRGFDPSRLEEEAPPGSFGLRSVRERIALLGGRMGVRSSPGAGACLTLTLPAPRARAEPVAVPGRS